MYSNTPLSLDANPQSFETTSPEIPPLLPPQPAQTNPAPEIANPGPQADPASFPQLCPPESSPAIFHSDPPPWPEPVSGADLLNELEQMLKRFVILPARAAETLALWIVHTHAFGLRDVSTYLGIESPEKRCGKTTLLAVLSELVHRPVVAANISSPAFFRIIEESRPTLIIDEADTFLRGNDELRGILNSGYSRKTAYVVRVAPEWSNTPKTDPRPELAGPGGATPASRGSRLVRFSCWCPKVIAAIGHLPETLSDRCIIIRMQRRMTGESCERLRALDSSELRRKCRRFVQDHQAAIAGAQPDIPAALNDRAADIWEPLLALADLAGHDWPDKARLAAVALTLSAQESSPMTALLLDVLFLIAGSEQEYILSRELVERLNSLPDRPWSELRRGKPINEHWLALQLRPYEVRPKVVRLGGIIARGYSRQEFVDAFRRYIPKAEVEQSLADRRSQNPPPDPGADGQIHTDVTLQ